METKGTEEQMIEEYRMTKAGMQLLKKIFAFAGSKS